MELGAFFGNIVTHFHGIFVRSDLLMIRRSTIYYLRDKFCLLGGNCYSLFPVSDLTFGRFELEHCNHGAGVSHIVSIIMVLLSTNVFNFETFLTPH